MKNRSALVLVMALFSTPIFPSYSALAADAEEQVSSVRDQWETAWNAKDLDTLVTLYADDAVLVFNGNAITGRIPALPPLASIDAHSTAIVPRIASSVPFGSIRFM